MTDEELENLAIQSAMNMGAAQDLFVVDVGWVLKDGQITEVGKLFFDKVYENRK